MRCWLIIRFLKGKTVVSVFSIIVPATSANVGPGFDCLGTALTLYNEFKFTPLEESRVFINVTGPEAEKVSTDENNLLYQAFMEFYRHLKQKPPSVKIEIKLGIPLARGLGSSATAILGGLLGANILAGKPLSRKQLMELAIAIEGHPDNVVPALLGGCQLTATNDKRKEVCDIPWHQEVIPVIAIPDFELSTSEARKVLPTQVEHRDAIFNTAHLGLLLRGLETGKKEWLEAALQDKLHQPFRKSLIKGYDSVYSAAVSAGAYGMVISGAGPTLLALTDTLHSEGVEIAMAKAWQQQGIKAVTHSLQVDNQGARNLIQV
ncbi:MAG: homoserine kinase [Mastigocoleus sp. MO_167.B18]|uniref:homoserine kinase n=1 Tax=Mastigocoleus sp. MO_188.B34 TaxID=3036635 RepID=UPI002618663C|nr:homoserine kinase [Mastigocoleus sp. MO_188.B34]MDJ0697246.1 homoserine kinase [Mastigocoleus sp. MO_188.B34]MDJ0774007.1 homoserine kinase [Mastigocoleus sp. MO_167.B18]